MSIEEAMPIARQIVAALEYAHDRKLLHRDIKPGNVLVSADGTPKLVDFGIGKVLSDTDQGDDSLTRTRARSSRSACGSYPGCWPLGTPGAEDRSGRKSWPTC